MNYIRVAVIQIYEGMLKYLNDPIGMWKDPYFYIFCEPFLEFAKGNITLSKAHEIFTQILIDAPNILADKYHSMAIKHFYEYKGGRDFVEDQKALAAGNKQISYNASRNLVKVFKEAMFVNQDIQRLKESAVIEGDKDFNKSLWSSYLDERPPKKRNRAFFIFARLHEDYILNSSQKEVESLARKCSLKEDFDTIRKYLNRLGIKRNRGRPSKVKDLSYDPIEKSDIKVLKEHKAEFKSYIFQTEKDLIDTQQNIKEIKDQFLKLNYKNI